jgi:site-specific DNA-cytosine methylase
MRKGTRSGLFWEWVRIVAELEQFGKRPTVLVAENVAGFVVAHKGNQLFPSF